MKCETEYCSYEATFNFLRIAARKITDEKNYCNEHARDSLVAYRGSSVIWPTQVATIRGMMCIDFEAIVLHMGYEERPAVAYLHEEGGMRRMGTSIDGCTWRALVAELRQEGPPQARTHGAWAQTIRSLGGVAEHILIDGHHQSQLTAKVSVRTVSGLISIDLRAGDAYALAVASNIPIFSDEKILEKFADRLDTG